MGAGTEVEGVSTDVLGFLVSFVVVSGSSSGSFDLLDFHLFSVVPLEALELELFCFEVLEVEVFPLEVLAGGVFALVSLEALELEVFPLVLVSLLAFVSVVSFVDAASFVPTEGSVVSSVVVVDPCSLLAFVVSTVKLPCSPSCPALSSVDLVVLVP